MLLLYAISPILVYGGELRRPDHQSFAMLLVTIANCAEVDFANQAVAKLERGKWCGVGNRALGFFYEPFTLLAITFVVLAVVA